MMTPQYVKDFMIVFVLFHLAANARQAKIASRVICGYASSKSSIVSPIDNFSKIRLTAMRVPLIAGRPPTIPSVATI